MEDLIKISIYEQEKTGNAHYILNRKEELNGTLFSFCCNNLVINGIKIRGGIISLFFINKNLDSGTKKLAVITIDNLTLQKKLQKLSKIEELEKEFKEKFSSKAYMSDAIKDYFDSLIK